MFKSLKARRAHYRRNRKRILAQNSSWKKANHEKVSEANRRWQKANPAIVNAKSRAWRLRNLEKRRLYKIAWRLRNPGVNTAQNAEWRAAKLQACPAWADRDAIKNIYEEAKRYGKVVDHIVPLRHRLVCGLHVHWNLQLLTNSENCKKHNRFIP